MAWRPGREAQNGQRALRGQGAMPWRLRLTDMLGRICDDGEAPFVAPGGGKVQELGVQHFKAFGAQDADSFSRRVRVVEELLPKHGVGKRGVIGPSDREREARAYGEACSDVGEDRCVLASGKVEQRVPGHGCPELARRNVRVNGCEDPVVVWKALEGEGKHVR